MDTIHTGRLLECVATIVAIKAIMVYQQHLLILWDGMYYITLCYIIILQLEEHNVHVFCLLVHVHNNNL